MCFYCWAFWFSFPVLLIWLLLSYSHLPWSINHDLRHVLLSFLCGCILSSIIPLHWNWVFMFWWMVRSYHLLEAVAKLQCLFLMCHSWITCGLHPTFCLYGCLGRIPFAYLEDIHMRFTKTYGHKVYTALAYEMNDEFSRVLHQQMEYFSTNPNADTLNRVIGEMNEVRFLYISYWICISMIQTLYNKKNYAGSQDITFQSNEQFFYSCV